MWPLCVYHLCYKSALYVIFYLTTANCLLLIATECLHRYLHCFVAKAEWTMKVIIDIARKEGVRFLMKGLGPRLIAVPSYMSVFYVVNEELEWYLLKKKLT